MKNFSVKKAHKTQLCLSQKIILKDKLPPKIRIIAGVDVSYVGNIGVGAIAVLDYESLKLLETQVATCQVRMPYIPTLLSFREIPPTLAAINKLKLQPDVFLVDAQGFAHPYRCGFASHLGLAIGKPTVCAEKRLASTLVIADVWKKLSAPSKARRATWGFWPAYWLGWKLSSSRRPGSLSSGRLSSRTGGLHRAGLLD